MKQLALSFILLIFSNINQLFSQNISFIDSRTLESIPGVIVSDTSKQVFEISNRQGKINITNLLPYNIVIIQHNYYKTIRLNLDSIKSLNYKIYLEEITFQLDQLIITANKWEQRKDELPFSISEINSKKVNFSNPISTPDLPT